MARGINKVILVGNLGADPETRYMPSGKAVTNIRIATSENWTDKQSGDKQERTEWHSVVVWGKRGEALHRFLTKGSNIFVEGSLRTSSYEDREGVKRYKTEVVANRSLRTAVPPWVVRRSGSAPRLPRSITRLSPSAMVLHG